MTEDIMKFVGDHVSLHQYYLNPSVEELQQNIMCKERRRECFHAQYAKPT